MSAETETVMPGKYRHFKGGEYQVTGVARHSESGELLWCIRRCMASAGYGFDPWRCLPSACFMRV